MSDLTREQLVRERAALRERFGSAYDDLVRLLFEEDPEGLNFGNNVDEYDPEVRIILPRRGDCSTVDEVQDAISKEFRRWFGAVPAERRSAYRGLAERIVTEFADLLRHAGNKAVEADGRASS
jgi:hypothetical protein